MATLGKRRYAKPYHCSYCGRGFHYHTSMEDHVHIMHSDKKVRWSFEENVDKLGGIFRREAYGHA